MEAKQLLLACKLRDTQSRRLVLTTLLQAKKSLTQKDICDSIQNNNNAINLATVYRVLEKFTSVGLVHLHGYFGGYVVCSQLDVMGHHVLVSCSECGKVEECCNAELCAQESKIAATLGFKAKRHLSEIIAICPTCS